MDVEPWRPRNGDRVRVRETVGEILACAELPHYPEERGHTGTVFVGRLRHGCPHHPYFVQFDRPCPVITVLGYPIALPARHFAIDELESVE